MILNAELEGIGPFKKRRKFVFKPGLNVITGKNASGKTALLHAISILNGHLRQRVYQPLELCNSSSQKSYAKLETNSGKCSMTLKEGPHTMEFALNHEGAQKVAFIGMSVCQPSIALNKIGSLVRRSRSDGREYVLLETSFTALGDAVLKLQKNGTKIVLIDDIIAKEPGDMAQLVKIFSGKNAPQGIIATHEGGWEQLDGINIVHL